MAIESNDDDISKWKHWLRMLIHLMILECNVCGCSFDTDLTNSTAFSNMSLWDAEKSCYLLDNLFILPCELTSLTLRVTELEVTNPQYSREHTEYPERERLRYIQNLQEVSIPLFSMPYRSLLG